MGMRADKYIVPDIIITQTDTDLKCSFDETAQMPSSVLYVIDEAENAETEAKD